MKKETEDGEIGCVVPVHRELKVGTLSGILKQQYLFKFVFKASKPFEDSFIADFLTPKSGGRSAPTCFGFLVKLLNSSW